MCMYIYIYIYTYYCGFLVCALAGPTELGGADERRTTKHQHLEMRTCQSKIFQHS